MLALLALARAAIGIVGSRAGLTAIGTAAALDIGPFSGGGLFGGGSSRRRRRRRSLSASDREDLLFLSSMMTKSGLERVAAVMIARN